MSVVAPILDAPVAVVSDKRLATNTVDPFLALRGLAAFLVLVGHCNYRHNLTHIWSFAGHNISWLINPNASASVVIFFTLSGYLMGKLFYSGKYEPTRESVLKFWKNRILRICPLYYSLVLFIGVFAYTGVFKPENIGVLAQVLTFTYGDFTKDIFSGQFWSISTEMQFYLLVPFIIALIKPRVRTVASVACTLVAALGGIEAYKCVLLHFCSVNGTVVESRYFSYIYSAVWANLDAFLIGLLINPLLADILSKRRPDSRFVDRWRPLAISAGWLIMAISAGVTANLHYRSAHRTETEFVVIPLVAGLCTMAFILLNEVFNGQKITPLNAQQIAKNPRRIVELLGVLSYGIYLWHFSIINRVEQLVTNTHALPHFIEVVALVTLISAVLASLTYLAIERPCNRYRKAK